MHDVSSEWKHLLPEGYRIDFDGGEYVLWRAGQNSGHVWPTYERAVCYAHFLCGVLGYPKREDF